MSIMAGDLELGSVGDDSWNGADLRWVSMMSVSAAHHDAGDIEVIIREA
jgi:hypothetical protein